MVKLMFVLCAAQVTACHQVDPLYAPMPVLTCNMQQMSLYALWAQANPELVAGQRLGRTRCIRVDSIEVHL